MTHLKFCERLYVKNKEVKLVSCSCLLSYQTPGSANIITQDKPEIGALISYEFGYNNELTTYFTGYIESFREINSNQFSLFARELSGVLRKPLPLTIQHTTLRELLTYIQNITGLKFILPKKEYMDTKAPFVINHGSGYALFDQLGNIFGIERYLWQQLGNGLIYVGSWYDSMWSKKNIPIPTSTFKSLMLNRATIPVFPNLRPGVSVNGQRIRSITTASNEMVVEWMTK